VPVINTYHL